MNDYMTSLGSYYSDEPRASGQVEGQIDPPPVSAGPALLQGKRVLVFGYGGNFALGCMLLKQDAAHVVLCDKYAAADDQLNASLISAYGEFLVQKGSRVLPNPEAITLLQTDIRDTARAKDIQPVDLVLSRSVFEHLDDLQGITQALVDLTTPGGLHIHFINLGDHYFKYPFEMLAYSEETWSKWLNPTSNLNRCRYPGYKRLFEQFFDDVRIEVRERDLKSFEQTRPRIRPEFLTGDPQIDAITKLRVVAARPRSTSLAA
jgi:SAM-dependent methyltransferase